MSTLISSVPLHDAHCHLDWVRDAEGLAAEALAEGTLIFCNTITPAGYDAAVGRFAAFPNVRVGVGLHPWYCLSEGRVLTAAFEASFERADAATAADGRLFVGEVGLDLGKCRAATARAQRAAFEQVVRLTGERGNCVLSLHAIHAADEVLDALEAADVLSTSTCIFHWFSGTSEALQRALRAGCLFSVNPMMASSRRGREYIRQIPADRLLLETDAPPGEGAVFPYADQRKALLETCEVIAEVKGEEALAALADTARALFGR